MEELLERLLEEINILKEEIEKLEELAELFPELQAGSFLKKEAIEEIIERLEGIVEEFEE
jgi:hypothetical protein